MSTAAAALIYDDNTPDTVLEAVAGIPNVKRLRADVDVCRAFQIVRLPVLTLYNADGDETARACGDLHVQELIRQTTAEA